MMKIKKRLLCMLLAISMVATLSLRTEEVYAASFNPVIDTITSTSDSRVSEMLSAISLQSFSSTTATKVTNYISYFIYDSKYAAIGGSAWPYTNESGYVSTVTDGTYTISGINGSGCFAYSKYVMNVVYGTTGEVLAEGESAGNVTASGLETFLRTYAQAGEQIRLGNIHSVTFISCTDSGFYYMDYWSGYIRLHYTTFAAFASACNTATSSVPLWLYNANTAKNDVSLQTSGSTTPSDGTASTLNISPTSYPSGQIIVGNYFNLKGTISSNYTLTTVTATIYSESGEAQQSKTVTPNTTTLSIYSSDLNNLHFGNLEVGGYYLEYTATDSSGKSVVWTSDVFYVVSSTSTLTITPVDYPTGSMTAQAFTLTGSVTSNYTLNSVSAYIYNTNGDTLYSAMVTNINSTSFSIANSGIDNSLPFGSLAVGSYYLVYEATDKSGASASWTSEVFNIVSSTSSSESSSSSSSSTASVTYITITPSAYPYGNISAASFTLAGTVTGTYKLASVTGKIISADGTVMQTQTASGINSKTYSIENGVIDNNLKFSSLTEGYYYLQYTASDVNGNTATWESPIFAVAEKTLYADLTNSSAWYYTQAYALTQQGIFSGVTVNGSTYFYPNQNLSRAQAVVLFYQLYSYTFGTPGSTKITLPFTDISSGWYSTALKWAYNNGLVSGTSATTFEPNRSITRQEMACMIYNYARLFYSTEASGSTPLSSYSDGSSVSSWARTSVNWCITNGIFSSTSTSKLTFSPTTTTTRSQAAVLFYNIQNELS